MKTSNIQTTHAPAIIKGWVRGISATSIADVAGLEWVVMTPTQLAANTNDWAPVDATDTTIDLDAASIIRASTSASWNLTGLTAPNPADEVLKVLENVGTKNLVLVHNATSTAANRFDCAGDVNVTLSADGSAFLLYDTISSRWRVVAVGTGGGSGGTGTPGWFNVKAYGATGDGSTDDTAAVNLAIAALIAYGTGVLYFPASPTAYLVSSALTTISVPCTVMGDGWMTGASGPISRISFTSTSTSLFTVSANGCHFRHFAALQTGGVATAGAAITSTGGTLADYDHVLFDGFYINIDQENSAAWAARRCYFGTSRKYAIKVRNTATPDAGDWNITDCYFSNGVAGDAAIRIESSGGGKIIGNKIVGNASGSTRFSYAIDVAIGTGVTTTVLLIEGNSLENVTTDAIRVAVTGAGTYALVNIVGNEAGLYGNNSGRAVNLSGAGLTDVLVAHNTWRTDGTARAAVAVTNSTNVRIGPNILDTFNAEYTNSGGTVTDATGAIGAAVVITGTPTSGQVPVASSGTAAAWGTVAGGITAIGTPAITYGTPAAGAGTTVVGVNAVITKPAEADLNITDVTTKNVTSTTHGFAPKSGADATTFLNGAATPAYAAVKDSDLSTTDITTNNVSTSKHGFAPKAPADATKYLDGTGAYSVPAGGSAVTTTKGDVSGYSTLAARIPVGTDGQSLTADSGAALGVSYQLHEVLMVDGITSPPEPLTTEDGTDWLYSG